MNIQSACELNRDLLEVRRFKRLRVSTALEPSGTTDPREAI
jgi:hypothetical protein